MCSEPLKETEPSGNVAIGESDILLVLDVQNDFCPGGRLPSRNAPHEAVTGIASLDSESTIEA